jgi:Fe-S cluster biogenesis protein NfuA
MVKFDFELMNRCEEALEGMRPYIASHGGDVQILEVTPEKVLRLQMIGSCSTCPMSMVTVKLGIQKLLAEKVPELTGVEAITDEDLDLDFDFGSP